MIIFVRFPDYGKEYQMTEYGNQMNRLPYQGKHAFPFAYNQDEALTPEMFVKQLARMLGFGRVEIIDLAPDDEVLVFDWYDVNEWVCKRSSTQPQPTGKKVRDMCQDDTCWVQSWRDEKVVMLAQVIIPEVQV